MKTNDKRLAELKEINADKLDKKLKFAAWVILIVTVLAIVVLAIVTGILSFKELEEGMGIGGIPLSLQYALVIFVSTLIALVIITILTFIFFWKPIKTNLEARKVKIESNIENASLANQIAEANWKEAKEAKAEVKHEAKEIISESKTQADKERRAILDKAKLEQEVLITKSREQIEKEKEQLKDDIRNEILATSILAAEKILEKELDKDANNRMVNELLESLK